MRKGQYVSKASITLRKTTICLWLPVAALIVGGCDQARLGFERIKLGKSLPPKWALPKESIYSPHSDPQGKRVTFGNVHSTIFPWWGQKRYFLHTVADERGITVAKAYYGSDWVWWLFFTAFSEHFILDVEVPAEWFKDPPKAFPAGQIYAKWFGAFPLHETYVGSFNPDNYERSLDKWFEGFSSAADKLSLPKVTKNAGSYVVISSLLTGHSAHTWPIAELRELFTSPDAFAGVTTAGYDWRHRIRSDTNWPDIRYRIRNLGGCRIRIEIWNRATLPGLETMLQ